MLGKYESEKLDLCKEKSTAIEAQDQICLRYISQKNLTHIKRNSSQLRHKVKCA
ncbi:hypothetical protein BHM03_00038148 [Ensete ventricosum]|nr:hypothetical protein BHM03_00038148 [Ensete ventricosum]